MNSCRLIAVLALSASIAQAHPVSEPQSVPPAYERAARMEDVPARILFALALQESGLPWHGRLVPWPWTLNVAGAALRYASRREACSALQGALQDLPTSATDVGLGQINVGFQGSRVRDPCELLDPYLNLALAARILREQHRPGEGWLLAVGRYHRPAGGEEALRYQRSVQAHLAQLE
jgi:hypothetical protein